VVAVSSFTPSDGGAALNGFGSEKEVYQPTSSYTLQSGYYYVASYPQQSGSDWTVTSGGFNSDFSGVAFASNNLSPGSGEDYQLGITVVPEAPITGAAIGFGAMAIVGFHILRRKLSAAKSA